MIVGKTFSSMSIEELYRYTDDNYILSLVFPDIHSLPCLIQSPFRQDRHPSFSIFIGKDSHIHYKDMATGESGDVLALYCKRFNCSIPEAITNIVRNYTPTTISIRPTKYIKKPKMYRHSVIQVKVRPWKKYDYEYWNSYGISKKWLRLAEIYPISHKIVTKKHSPEDRGKRYVFSADKYTYVFVERKEGCVQLKVYSPYNTKGFKWSSNMSDNVISLWTKIPKTGEKLIICSSLKDALCVWANIGIPTICPQGEGYSFSQTAINQLKQRYQHIYIAYDTDKAGIEDAKRLSKETGFEVIIPNLKECKDFSDAYKAYGKEWFITNILPLFNKQQITDNLPF